MSLYGLLKQRESQQNPTKVGVIGAGTFSSADGFIADVASMTKKDLKPGDVLDGEGGYTVFGRLTSARESLTNRYLPLGLSSDAKLIKPIAKDTYVTYDDVELDETSLAFKIRKTMEADYQEDGFSAK